HFHDQQVIQADLIVGKAKAVRKARRVVVGSSIAAAAIDVAEDSIAQKRAFADVTVPEIGADKRLQPGVLVEGRGHLRRDVRAEVIGYGTLPGQLENVAGALTGKSVESQTARGLIGIGVLIDELAKDREKFGPAYLVIELLGDAFRCEVLIPNHRRGEKRIG